MLPRPHPRRERQLPVAAVAEEEELGDPPRLVLAAEAGHEIEREVVPRRRAARGHQPVLGPGRHQHPLGPQPHRRVAPADQVGARPVAGRLLAVEQPGLGEHQRPGADRADQRALRVLLPQPGRRRRPAPARLVGPADREVADDHHVGARHLVERELRRDQDAGAVAERRPLLGDDPDRHPPPALRPAGQHLPADADEGEDVAEAVEHAGRHLGHRDEADRDLRGEGRRHRRDPVTFGPIPSSPSLTPRPAVVPFPRGGRQGRASRHRRPTMTKRTSLDALGAAWRRWWLTRHTRSELDWLTDRQLADIGVARGDVRPARRPRPPRLNRPRPERDPCSTPPAAACSAPP